MSSDSKEPEDEPVREGPKTLDDAAALMSPQQLQVSELSLMRHWLIVQGETNKALGAIAESLHTMEHTRPTRAETAKDAQLVKSALELSMSNQEQRQQRRANRLMAILAVSVLLNAISGGLLLWGRDTLNSNSQTLTELSRIDELFVQCTTPDEAPSSEHPDGIVHTCYDNSQANTQKAIAQLDQDTTNAAICASSFPGQSDPIRKCIEDLTNQSRPGVTP